MHFSLLETKKSAAFQLFADVTKGQTGIYRSQFELCRAQTIIRELVHARMLQKSATLNNEVQK